MEAPHVSTGHIEEHEATINRPVQVHPEIVPVDEKNGHLWISVVGMFERLTPFDFLFESP